MTPRKHPLRRWTLAIGLPLCFVLAYPLWISRLGTFLNRSDPPARSDAVVVLAGDYAGLRILKAASLVREGFASSVLVSAPTGVYGGNEAELAIPFAVRHGYPTEWFTPVVHDAHSTKEEAQVILAELRERGARSCLLVTSGFHTRRAGAIFRAAAPQLQFHVISADSQVFDLAQWWRGREGRKIVFLEWTKWIAYCLGV